MAQENGFEGIGWSFEMRRPTGNKEFPRGSEHFIDDTKTLAQSVVREGTQNTLDVPHPENTGPVRFSISRRTMSAQDFSVLMSGFGPHAEAARSIYERNGHNYAPEFQADTVNAVVIEDFGTTGLTGSIDPVRWDFEDIKNFGSFFWKQGDSHKSKNSGGRHGIGKAIFAELSEMRAVIGITEREGDPSLVAYGRATLVPHIIDDQWYDSYGIFGEVRDGQSYPIVGERAEELSRLLQIDRKGRNGLSLFIPFVKDSVTTDAMVRSVVSECFFQICGGMLVVEIDGVVIDAGSILKIAAQYPECANLLPSIELAFETTNKEIPVFVPKFDPSAQLAISEELFDAGDIDRMRTLFEAGETVHVEFKVPAYTQSGFMDIGIGHVFMRKHDEVATRREVFTRGRVTVMQAQGANARSLALFTAEEGVLQSFLGDCEDVSHNKWSFGRAEKNFTKASDTLRKVKRSIPELYSILSGVGRDGKVKDAFKNYFWRTREEKEAARVKPVDRKVEVVVPKEIPLRKPQPFVVAKTAGGDISIVRTNEIEGRFEAVVTLYYSTLGEAKPKFNPADFDLNGKDFTRSCAGDIVATVVEANVIRLVAEDPGSKVILSGFDPRRDLHIVTEMSEVVEAE